MGAFSPACSTVFSCRDRGSIHADAMPMPPDVRYARFPSSFLMSAPKPHQVHADVQFQGKTYELGHLNDFDPQHLTL